MAADGVDAAPLTTDAEFVRRIYIDLTGRIPTYEQAAAFLARAGVGCRRGGGLLRFAHLEAERACDVLHRAR